MPKHPKQKNKETAGDRRWVERELQTLRLGDERLEKRVKKMLGDFGERPGASIPQASGDWGATKGAYRCLSHEGMKVSAVEEAHCAASVERAREQRVVLAVQDTTTLNFSTHP